VEYISEEQQVEQIKKWWKENGSSIIIGIVLGVGGIMGWRFWSDHQINQSAQASAHFDAMMFAVENNQFEKAEQSANIIVDDFSSTPYLVYSQLTLAKIQFEQKDYDNSALSYQAIIDNNKSDSISFIARKRLADVYIDQKKYAEALGTLNVDYPESFTAAFEERKGDIYRYQGKKDDANSAYLLAKLAFTKSEDAQFLQQKMDDLGR
jgi:predicted negative regulator of RcsB-dependent stress response